MKIFKALLSLLMLALLIVTALFIDFTYKTFSARPRQVQADAIVVLAGGKGRVDEGVRLFRERRATWLFLVGVDPTVRKSDLYRPKPGDPSADNVVLEKLSRNTLENAIYGRDILVEHKVRSVLLITSRYHLKRSAILFRNALPPEVAVYPYPVDSSNVKEEWWHHLGTFRLLFSEFYKYCIFRVFFLFSPGELRPVSL
ncbi:YdcF family protein [Trichlorobacter lovleyi]|uniref:YdcF family protein n=1 Tax=Trichlorobacter lovleyi TaxID=313985 RepID=UPI00224092F4|nr:YdcF family protein [Trichlorobacter lovleyi]QOX79316.1 YdcF family protein [Trichlorobacter lovleyi]